MHNPAAVLENDTQLLWDFDIHTYNRISVRRPDLIIINNKKRTCKIMDFAVPVDHRIKLKEWEKKDKYLDLSRELKKWWNMKVTIIQMVIGVFGPLTKGLLKGLEDLKLADEWRPSKLQHYWERLEYWEESWRLEETCSHSNSNNRPSAKTNEKINNNNIIWPIKKTDVKNRPSGRRQSGRKTKTDTGRDKRNGHVSINLKSDLLHSRNT